jgi:hypothetical protein
MATRFLTPIFSLARLREPLTLTLSPTRRGGEGMFISMSVEFERKRSYLFFDELQSMSIRIPR